MRLGRLLTLLLLVPLTAGCAALDSAKEGATQVQDGLEEARAKLQQAQEELSEAKARYERVRSLTVIRTEAVDLNLTPVYDAEARTLGFTANATRGEDALPSENLTRLPRLTVSLTGGQDATFQCDPLTCRFILEEGDEAKVTWEDHSGESWLLDRSGLIGHCTPVCVVPAPEGTQIRLADAEVLASTSVGDATS